MADAKKLLADGLSAGFAGHSTFETIQRGPFQGKQSLFTPGAGKVYLDQWFASLRGGGQELVQDGSELATRLYAGGTIDDEELTKLGITEDQVSEQLKKSISELGEKTRLGENCSPEPDGDWKYDYQILDTIPEIGLRIGLESIYYKGSLVFAHGFLQSPVK